ncbi:MAG TPA: glycerol-3-phosphate dehydrogenase/oxidase [Mycobacteriales bacterium]|nr:glycerol-3-phosphate dehydrogenase/oxidase [Mycobacteriales bacterium]
MSASLDATRRARELDALAGETVDVLVVGGGITGAGVALDAASRGLSVALVERADLAQGTSRWSSKLVHGGLRYLASGDVGLAYESAVERGILLARTAPHLVRPLANVLPLAPATATVDPRLTRAGLAAADLLRRAAGTPGRLLPRSRRVGPTEAARLAPAVRTEGLAGALVWWDGQLTDDAALVVAVARTAAAHGARILTRVEARAVTGDGATLLDRRTGATLAVRARSVVNAAGVWAGEVDPGVVLRPSRGTHLVVPSDRLGGLPAALTVPYPGERNRYVFALPAGGGRAYLGLTDDPADLPGEADPAAGPSDVDTLLAGVAGVLAEPLTREDVLGTFTGLRPLLAGGAAAGRSADLSRRHAVRIGATGVATVVGGKLTTYRRMAEDAVDAVVAARGLGGGPCRTRDLPLVGAAPLPLLRRVGAPDRLVRRYGTEAPLVHEPGNPPLADGLALTAAEVRFAVRHEGALDADDVLHRRTRIGLVPADAAACRPAVEALLAEESESI